jgi:hypothetical protein
MTDLLDQLATSITNLDGRLRDLASGPPLRACYDVLIPDSTIVIPGFSPPGYLKFPDGTVMLSGTVFPTTDLTGACLFTLPDGNRPATLTSYPIAYGGTVQVGPDGCVRLVDPPNIVIDLVHQQFFPDPTDTDVTMSQNPQDDVIFVSRNGVVQSELNGDYFRLDDVITFSDPFVADETVIVCWSPIVTAPGIPAHEEFSPTPATESVTMSHEALRFSNVSRNGIVQRAGPLSGPTTDYTVFGNSLVFSTPFVAAERVVVGYSILPLTFGRPDHYETSPTAGATVVTLPKVAASVLIVARNGVTEAITGGHYTQAGYDLTFSTPFVSGETVVVGYVSTRIPGISVDSISFRARV